MPIKRIDDDSVDQTRSRIVQRIASLPTQKVERPTFQRRLDLISSQEINSTTVTTPHPLASPSTV